LAQVFQVYPPTGISAGNLQQASLFIGDLFFICGTRRFVRFLSQPRFYYHFDHTPCPNVPPLGVYHGSELVYVLNQSSLATTLGFPYPCNFQPSDLLFAQQIERFWTNFATSGNPNSPNVPPSSWPTYDTLGDQDLYLNDQYHTETNYHKSQCDFWDGILGY